jgi:5-methylcytosine-specific restriction enzyme A
MKPWAEKFYLSDAWRRCRKAYFIKAFGVCERCGRPGKIVHHKVHLTPDNIDDQSITLNFNNLELLCQECHNNEHHRVYGSTRDGLCFTADGQLVQVSAAANNGEV